MSKSDILFSGEPELLGGLSNEDKLYEVCPEKFKKNNPWSEYAMRLFYSGGKIGHWKWKSQDEKERGKQFACFYSLMGSFGIPHEGKKAVAGWMLSEMLEEVPKYMPQEK